MEQLMAVLQNWNGCWVRQVPWRRNWRNHRSVKSRMLWQVPYEAVLWTMTVTVMDISATEVWKCESLGVIISLLLLTSSNCVNFIYFYMDICWWVISCWFYYLDYLLPLHVSLMVYGCVCVCEKEKKVNGKPNFILKSNIASTWVFVCVNKTFHLWMASKVLYPHQVLFIFFIPLVKF